MGLPLDTTAAQPKLKLYRYGSPSLSLSATLFVHLFHLSPSFLSGRITFSFSHDLTVSVLLCIFTFPFLSLSFRSYRSFSCLFLFLSALSPFLVHTRRYSKRPTAFARYLPPKSTLRFLRHSSRAQPPHPSASLEGIYRLRSLNNETPFPRLRLNPRPEEA